MDQSRLNLAISKLNAKGVNKPCPRCGTARFNIVGESSISLQENPGVFQVGGPSIPTIIVACDHCGYITQHAKVTLGMK